MKFEQAIDTLNPSSDERIKLFKILQDWDRVYPNEVSNLFKDSFLEDSVMQHIVIKICECPGSWTFHTLRQELEKHCYSWMQLKGGDCTVSNVTDFGIVTSVETLRHFFARTTSFVFPKRFDDFLDELVIQNNPGQWAKNNGLGNIRIKPSHYICWFFWDSSQQIEDPLKLFQGKTGKQICEALNLGPKKGQMVGMTFDMDLSKQNSNGWHLFRPTWVEGGFLSLFNAVSTTNPKYGYGVVNSSYKIPIDGKDITIQIAEGVSRSAYVQLKYLKNIQIF